MKEKKERIFNGLSIVGAFAIVVVFFIISRSGFFVGDDWAMGVGLTSFREVVAATVSFYRNWGGSVFSAFCQYLFCGMWMGNKLWFDLANTLMFFLTLLLCGKLCGTEKKSYWPCVLLFSLILWFLVPVPNETFFWPVGSTAYLWSSVLSLLFLWMVEKYKHDELPLWKNMALLVLSIVCMIGISGIVTGGFLFLYCFFHSKDLSKTVRYMLVGCIIGGLIGVLSPGNFARAGTAEDEFSIVSYLLKAFSPPNVIGELLNYKALWLFVIGLVLLFVFNRALAKEWCKKRGFLLLVLMGGVFVNSTVFAPFISSTRTLYFPEVLSMVLFVGMVNSLVEEVSVVPSTIRENVRRVCVVVAVVLFGIFLFDGQQAIASTKRQRAYNDKCLNEIREANGVVVLDDCPVSQRMAMGVTYPHWTWEGIAYKLGLDSVHVYPSYCLDKYWGEPLPSGAGFYVINSIDGELGEVIIRHPEGLFPNGVDCIISYNRPRKWFRVWYDKLTHYQYARTSEVSKEAPDFRYEGYCYYGFYMKSENCKGITDVSVVSSGM